MTQTAIVPCYLPAFAWGVSRRREPAYLWMREAGGRHGVVVQHVRPLAHVLYCANALGTGCMRQHVLACKPRPH